MRHRKTKKYAKGKLSHILTQSLSWYCVENLKNQKGWLASAKLRSLVEVILARPIGGQDFKFSFNVIFLSTTDVNYVEDEVDPRPVLQEVDQHV